MGIDFDLLRLNVGFILSVTLTVEEHKIVGAELLFLKENLDHKAAPVLDTMLLESFFALAENAPKEAI